MAKNSKSRKSVSVETTNEVVVPVSAPVVDEPRFFEIDINKMFDSGIENALAEIDEIIKDVDKLDIYIGEEKGFVNSANSNAERAKASLEHEHKSLEKEWLKIMARMSARKNKWWADVRNSARYAEVTSKMSASALRVYETKVIEPNIITALMNDDGNLSDIERLDVVKTRYEAIPNEINKVFDTVEDEKAAHGLNVSEATAKRAELLAKAEELSKKYDLGIKAEEMTLSFKEKVRIAAKKEKYAKK